MQYTKKRFWILFAISIVTVLLLALLVYIQHKNTLPTTSEVSQAIVDEFANLIGYSVETSTPIVSTIYNGFSVTVNSITLVDASDDTNDAENMFLAVCTLENYDVSKAYTAMETQTQEMTADDFYHLFAQQFELSDRLSKEHSLLINQNEDGTYSAVFTEQALDTAMGGFLSYFAELYDIEESQ